MPPPLRRRTPPLRAAAAAAVPFRSSSVSERVVALVCRNAKPIGESIDTTKT
jgi:hypothetical protein